jgi:NTE family protein
MTKLNAVFQGGGVKGIGLVGALARVEQENVEFTGLAGTSAGAIVAALFAAGYTTKELKTILLETRFQDLLDPGFFMPWQLWRRYGIHRGQKLYEWLYQLLQKKNIVHFEDLKTPDLKIVASDIRHKKILVFDAEHHPSLEVAEAVRMSIGIPFFFEAYRFGQTLVVDGGLLSNYPLWVFAHSKEPTLGFKLVSKGSNPVPQSPNSFQQFLGSLVSTMLEARDKEDEKTIEWARTIHIPSHDVATTDFSLDENTKEMLYGSGFVAADEYLRARGLVHPSWVQVADSFESIKRFRELTTEHIDRIYRPYEVRRKVLIEPPDAELDVIEFLTNLTEHPQHEVNRFVTTDTRTEKKHLEIRAWTSLEGAESEASVEVTPSKDSRLFAIRIGLKGRVVRPGQMLQVRWKCKFPGSVSLNDDYWVFPVNLYENRPERLVVDIVFSRIPADLLFFAVTEAGLRPMNLVGPNVTVDTGKPSYAYSTTVESPKDFHLLRWRIE